MTVYINGVAQVDAEVGGLYGINVETLADDKTLTPGVDKIYQYLDEGGADRTITLVVVGATAGDRFVIRHNGVFNDTHKLVVEQAEVVQDLDHLYAGAIKSFIFDGSNWVPFTVGTGEEDLKYENVALGSVTDASNRGAAVGYYTSGRQYGAAVGNHADAFVYGVAIGSSSNGHDYGVGIGYMASGDQFAVAIGYRADTFENHYSIALGYYSECVRWGETSTAIDVEGYKTDNVVQGRWRGEIAGGAGATEIFCAGQANRRFTIRPNSVLAFRMIIVARDNVANEVAMYTVVDGLIKRDGAGNTAMVNCTVTVVHEDDAGWDCAITADDGNEALIITVTGDGVNITQWAARMDGVETHFGA